MPLLDPARRHSSTDYHLVAGIPTPNGPTHLGHVGGPFLRMDILARFQRMCGNRAFLISGTDGYESYVRLAAVRTGVQPAEIANRYHHEIEGDLAAIDIVHDAFIDPLDARWSARYARWHHHLLERLWALGHIERRCARVLYSKGDRYLFGGFLAGRCPECGRPVVGTSCEECGMWFSTNTIVEPRSNLDDGDAEWQEVSNLFLRLDPGSLHEALAESNLLPEHRRVVDGYLAREGPYWLMTQQADWGVPGPYEVSAPAVFSTYGLGILAYAALCGEEYGLLSGRGLNALAAGSGAVTVSAQGFDSIVPDAFAILVLRLLGPELGAYDHLTLNRFLLLEGRKFSTSMRHAIWTRELTGTVDSDLVRHYLARISPGEAHSDFRIDDFVALTNQHVVDGLQRQAQASWERLDGVPEAAPDGRWLDHLDVLLERQRAALDPGRLRLAEVVEAIDAWPIDAWPAHGGAEAYWWLKGAALLASSVMPRWALATWRGLGHDGNPSVAAFWQAPPLATDRPRHHFDPLDAAKVRLLARIGAGDG
jgi:methionyl-tRNA synthetase